MQAARAILIPALLLALGAGCTGLAARGQAETAVSTFHERLDAERYADIYDATDDLFKNATPRSQFIEILGAVHRKLGMVQATEQRSFYSEDRAGTNAGSYLQLTYDTTFAEGHATEQFNWRVTNVQVRLAGYNINSALLITR